MPFIFSTLIVFATFAIQAKLQGKPPLTTAQAFSSLAIMIIFRSPASMLLVSLPILMSMVGTFERIEKYLKMNRFEDHRPLLDRPTSLLDDTRAVIELKDIVLNIQSETEPSPIAFTAPKGSITMVSGPVGCGKSMLLKAVLGEIHLKSGEISVSTPYIGYCAQTPWLQNSTLKKNILGANVFDAAWYQSILRTCNLEPDINQMPDGDDTLLGSRGVAVSGGQKHRIVSSPLFVDYYLFDPGTSESVVF
jgi:ATP-binding cassette, subfamily C (CFTR/MRP), member 1